jgi:hypothetical protein
MTLRRMAALFVGLGLACVVTACGSSSLSAPTTRPPASARVTTTTAPVISTTVPSTSTTGVAPTTTVPTGPPCTQAAIAAATTQGSPGTTVVSFACSGQYSYAFVDIPSPAPPAGPGSIEATFLFKADGASWQRADRSTDCPSVPTAIYQNACQTN